MGRTDVEFQSEGTTLRGWLYRPEGAEDPTPLVVMAHGFVGHREWVVPTAEVFAARGLACLVYDHACFGASDGEPRQEVDPARQVRGYRDAITFARTLAGVDETRIAIWGTSMAGAHVLAVAGVDGHRIRAVVSQVPAVAGLPTFQRLVPAHVWPDLLGMIETDREARFAGAPPMLIPVVSDDPTVPAALPGADTYEWLTKVSKEVPGYRNEVTVRSLDLCFEYTPEAFLERVAPTPIMMTIADRDNLCVTELQLAAYQRLREPKQLQILHGNHYVAYEDGHTEAAEAQADFLLRHLT
jgi:cephalosporin-C deacetylase-like acetyl esterase